MVGLQFHILKSRLDFPFFIPQNKPQLLFHKAVSVSALFLPNGPRPTCHIYTGFHGFRCQSLAAESRALAAPGFSQWHRLESLLMGLGVFANLSTSFSHCQAEKACLLAEALWSRIQKLGFQTGKAHKSSDKLDNCG